MKKDASGIAVNVSNPEKVLFPKDGYTKTDLVVYYDRIAPYMLPHLEDRPISMQRFPDGIDEESFFQKEIPEYFPDYFERLNVGLEKGVDKQYGMINNKEGLLYLANMASIHIHTWMSRKGSLKKPDKIVWDLDPMDDDFEKVRTGARLLRYLLNELHLEIFIKLTGSRGVHLVIPIEQEYSTKEVFDFSKSVSSFIAGKLPQFFTVEFTRSKRGKKLFVDFHRNRYAQTAIAPYSVRALDGAPVAMPITWEELDDENIHPQSFNIKNAFDRLDEKGDAWKDFFKRPQSITPAMEQLKRFMGR